MLVIFILAALGLVHGFDNPLCIARNCPSGTFCRIVVDSTTGVSSPKCLKGGYCPEPPLWEGLLFGGKQCQRQCEEDTDCAGGQICCNDFFGCGKKCRDPLPEYTCDHLRCNEGQTCVMKETQCSRPVCFPTPTCISSTCNPVCGSRTDVWMDVDHPHQTLVARAPMSAESSKLLPSFVGQQNVEMDVDPSCYRRLPVLDAVSDRVGEDPACSPVSEVFSI
ncbi:keratin-associated protein 9-7-like [Pomacea canaliculata]|uniref:keratin-associated protein 9-7-like n=1 Tax=Pomacea canaliculata TaxID=400727 RepID=UPI000D73F941|nr:keratin-associated protein 9-7-like [Pomacea canaliculata]